MVGSTFYKLVGAVVLSSACPEVEASAALRGIHLELDNTEDDNTAQQLCCSCCLGTVCCPCIMVGGIVASCCAPCCTFCFALCDANAKDKCVIAENAGIYDIDLHASDLGYGLFGEALKKIDFEQAEGGNYMKAIVETSGKQ